MIRSCLFCGADSSSSRSREHIIPESLGNADHILAPGIVCDSCNNYFANSVEKPVLDSDWFSELRFRQLVSNKRGRFPTISGILPPRFPRVPVTRDAAGNLLVTLEDESWRPPTQGALYIPAATSEPQEPFFSRFVAKMAIEALALRLLPADGGVEHVATCEGLNPLRKYARYGRTGFVWPVCKRALYSEADEHEDVRTGSTYQVLHEFDFVFTENRELIFVLAIFGQEYSIDMGEPTLAAYYKWLERNEGRSPLYSGKNAGIERIIPGKTSSRAAYPPGCGLVFMVKG